MNWFGNRPSDSLYFKDLENSYKQLANFQDMCFKILSEKANSNDVKLELDDIKLRLCVIEQYLNMKTKRDGDHNDTQNK